MSEQSQEERIAALVVAQLRKDSAVAPEYLSTKDAARFTGFSVKAFEAHRARGVGPRSIRIGHGYRYAISDLRAWMEANRQQ